jgi:hypothetical protein
MIDKVAHRIGCDKCKKSISFRQVRSAAGKSLTLFKQADGRHLCFLCLKEEEERNDAKRA